MLTRKEEAYSNICNSDGSIDDMIPASTVCYTIDKLCDDFEKDITTKFEGTSKYWLEHKFIEEVSKLDRGMYEVVIRKVT